MRYVLLVPVEKQSDAGEDIAGYSDYLENSHKNQQYAKHCCCMGEILDSTLVQMLIRRKLVNLGSLE